MPLGTRSQPRDGSNLQARSFTASNLQQNSLPSLPASDNVREHIWGDLTGSAVANQEPQSYRFISVAEALSEDRCLSRFSSPPTSKESTPQAEQSNVLLDLTRLESSSNPDVDPNTSQGSLGRHKPLLNLVWRDVGNGISRAYPRQLLTPLLSPKLPRASLNLTEERDWSTDFDEDNVVSKLKIHPDGKTTTPYEDIWLPRGDMIYDPAREILGHHAFSGKFESDPREDVNEIPRIAKGRASYHFVAVPECTSGDLIATAESVDNEQHISRSDDTCDQEHINIDSNSLSTNVRPKHLSPYSLSIVLRNGPMCSSTNVEDYTPSTSSGFSDTDDNQNNSKRTRSTLSRLRRHCRRRYLRVNREMTDHFRPSFTQVAVVRAAERLMRGRTWTDERSV